MKRILVFGLLAFAVASVTRGTPYRVAWEGNDYPENEGWERSFRAGGAARSLDGGIMTLDGLASIEVTDIYRMNRLLDPEADEEFVAEWRVRVDEVANPNSQLDPGIALYSDQAMHLILVFGVGEVRSVLEQQSVSFEPGVFHTWELRSPDMRSYSLMADGTVILSGFFVQSGAVFSRISWGDLVAGSNSRSDWDYVRFGVVPEPAGSLSFIALFLLLHLSRRFS